jgi:hypothetical protein
LLRHIATGSQSVRFIQHYHAHSIIGKSLLDSFLLIKSTNRPGAAVTSMNFLLLLHNQSIWSCRSTPAFTWGVRFLRGFLSGTRMSLSMDIFASSVRSSLLSDGKALLRCKTEAAAAWMGAWTNSEHGALRASSCSCGDVFVDVAVSDDSVGEDLAMACRNCEGIICSVAASLLLLVLSLPLISILVEVACSAALFGVMCSLFINRPEPFSTAELLAHYRRRRRWLIALGKMVHLQFSGHVPFAVERRNAIKCSMEIQQRPNGECSCQSKRNHSYHRHLPF